MVASAERSAAESSQTNRRGDAESGAEGGSMSAIWGYYVHKTTIRGSGKSQTSAPLQLSGWVRSVENHAVEARDSHVLAGIRSEGGRGSPQGWPAIAGG